MTKLRLAAAALNTTPLDWRGNLQCARDALEAARDGGVSLLCLPELSITGYGCEDAFFALGVQQTALEMLAEFAPATHGLACAVGLPLIVDGALYNASAMVVDGAVAGFVCKQFLAGDGIHYEPRWFEPWPAARTTTVEWLGRKIPVGDLLFDCGGVGVGLEICRDAWVAYRPARRLATRGARVILNPSASHFAFGKQEIRREFALEAARELGVAFVYCNLLGNESGRAIFDGGSLIAAGEGVVAAGPRFSFADFTLTTADVEVEEAPISDNESVVRCTSRLPAPADSRPATQPHPWDGSPALKEEEFSRAVALGLCDYLRKSRAGGLVVSLSGGADSSGVAALVFIMVALGVEEWGAAGLAARLRDALKQHGAADLGTHPADATRALVGQLLTCVYQATRNSGPVTREAAEAVAKAVGAEFLSWNVDALVDGYVDVVSSAVERKLTWEHDDLALQNIQARARGPGVWLLANLRGALLLATSNRSEAAVGYATMDGDTCGGLSPIAGIDKAFLLDWLAWMETNGPVGVGPLPALLAVNAQQPTAELRPPAESQTDEGDLMPYAVLDAIERAAIRDKLMPREVFDVVEHQFCQYPRGDLLGWVERFFRLWCRNQWKRERYAPSFHLDDENLDPKTWCRFPILSGGFEKELAELRAAVEPHE